MKKAVFTIVTNNYLAQAEAWARSVRNFNPEIDVFALVIDRLDAESPRSALSFTPITLRQLGPDTLVDVTPMLFYYNGLEISTALRPYVHGYFEKNTNYDRWLYLDGDSQVYASLSPVFDELDKAEILLSPHRLQPDTVEELIKGTPPTELNLLRLGIFNGGFLGLKRGLESSRFIAWNKSRLRYFCFDDNSVEDPRGLYVDQLWLNLVPSLFSSVSVCRHPGVNLAYWNLKERDITVNANGRFEVNGHPLILFHFSGWSEGTWDRITNLAEVASHPSFALLQKLSKDYLETFLTAKEAVGPQVDYTFGSFTDGTKVTLGMRRTFYNLWINGVWESGDPFSASDFFKVNFHTFGHRGTVSPKILEEEAWRLKRQVQDCYWLTRKRMWLEGVLRRWLDRRAFEKVSS